MENLTSIAIKIIWTGFILMTIDVVLLLITGIFIKPGKMEDRIIKIVKKILYIGIITLTIGIIILLWIQR